MNNKQEIRQILLQKRCDMSVLEWQKKSDRICNILQNYPVFQSAKTILAYISFKQEPDLSSLFTDDHQWGLPRCVKKTLIWHLYHPGDLLKVNNYGILEPDENSPIIQPHTVDLILVPAVSCDHNGYRLGYGGGYYDRLFADEKLISIPRIGIVFDFAFLPELPREIWDKHLSAICTENKLYEC